MSAKPEQPKILPLVDKPLEEAFYKLQTDLLSLEVPPQATVDKALKLFEPKKGLGKRIRIAIQNVRTRFRV